MYRARWQIQPLFIQPLFIQPLFKVWKSDGGFCRRRSAVKVRQVASAHARRLAVSMRSEASLVEALEAVVGALSSACRIPGNGIRTRTSA